MLDQVPDLSVENKSFLKSKISNLSPLPVIHIENGNTIVASPDIRAEVVSLEGGARLRVNGIEIMVSKSSNFETVYTSFERAIGKSKFSWWNSWSHLFINEAHAGGNAGLAVLGVVGVMLAAIFGAKAYSNYKDQKAAKDQSNFLPENATPEQIRQYQSQHGLNYDGSRQASERPRSFFGNLSDYVRGGARTKDFASSPSFYDGGKWGSAIGQAILKLPQPNRMLNSPPQDLLNSCPAFKTMSQEDKIKFWQVFFDALAMAESEHNTNDTYKEIPKTKEEEKNPVISRGLLALSWLSAKGHSGACRNADADNLHNPEYNLTCGVQIMEDQLRVHRTLITQTKSYYWSTLNPSVPRSPKTHMNGYDRFVARFNALKGQANRWPAACNSTSSK